MTKRLLRVACLAAVLVAAGPPATVRAEPAPGPQSTPAATPTPESTPTDSVGTLLTRLQTLYQQAEEASEAYNAADVALTARQAEERRLTEDLGRARAALGVEKAAAGRLAREQYQGAQGFSPYLRMLLSRDPQQAVDQRQLAAREGVRRAGVVGRLERGEQQAGVLATAARKALDAQQGLAAEQKRRREEVAGRLKEVERLLAALTPTELGRLGAREEAVTAGAQRELVGSGRLPARTGTPTAAGGAALRYAAEQIGKPYVWGAEGPASFDCSGLTSRAWEHAGRSIPRTSQEQWARLPRVPLEGLRPGDLVVYFPKATHVALYIGDGKVIQAPRPGAKVKVSPIAANPLLGAVRPDPEGTPLEEFTPPPLPVAATAGDDSGYASEAEPDPDTDTDSDSATSAR
ncbi:NlpC/P60 family protein [Streptomyces sp. NBC_00249]|uniref:C40 family peptidase n=1 Tax=Streptomyces sp. NBC_00249 TaxID=2975690 RepID=UPI002254A93C|nr:C40 family peptidase [Streptomyces sp. NBC_00249]MCX5194410.1 NlpC/P60 family protein [Streptomyces sp. NBC_00249]